MGRMKLKPVNPIKPLKILTYPNESLRTKAQKIQTFGPELQDTYKQLLVTMLHSGGVGLAANQVGLNVSMFVMIFTQPNGAEQFRVMINPEVLLKSDSKTILNEGCLSFPRQRVEVNRPEAVTVQYSDLDGKTHIEQFTGMNAKIVQHEIDHLNAVVIEDYKKKPDVVV